MKPPSRDGGQPRTAAASRHALAGAGNTSLQPQPFLSAPSSQEQMEQSTLPGLLADSGLLKIIDHNPWAGFPAKVQGVVNHLPWKSQTKAAWAVGGLSCSLLEPAGGCSVSPEPTVVGTTSTLLPQRGWHVATPTTGAGRRQLRPAVPLVTAGQRCPAASPMRMERF